MVKTKLGIDTVFCISLPTRNDRKEKINQRFGKLDFNFIEAIHGSDIDTSKLISDNKLNSEFYDPMGAINKNVIACSLSHLKCWEIFESSQTDICLILEDDVVITQDVFTSETDLETNEVIIQPSKFWKEMWTQLESLDWDIVFLGKKEKYVDGIDKTPLFCKPFWGSGLWGAHGYLINKDSVSKLIKDYQPIKYAIDVFLDKCSEDYRVYALKESLFRQETDIYLHDKDQPELVDSDTFHNKNRDGKFTNVKVDEIVDSVEFTNYPASSEYIGNKKWPPLIKAKFRL
tara:strand:- start:1886 stop:2749 length:864 start_codon:yes stop_codon:yes gene_type:complete